VRDGYVVAHVIGGKVGGGSLDPALAKLAVASVDAAIAEVAEAQHGVAARAQLVELGVGARAIEHRLAMGRLHRIHRGVYAVGHRTLSAKSRWMAAVLACGEGSALSYRSAGPLWGVRLSSRTAIEVTTRPGRRPRPGIELHYDRLADDEVTVVDGIPVTTVARTLLDLACVLDRDRLERARPSGRSSPRAESTAASPAPTSRTDSSSSSTASPCPSRSSTHRYRSAIGGSRPTACGERSA
jgi:hypothetical protein